VFPWPEGDASTGHNVCKLNFFQPGQRALMIMLGDVATLCEVVGQFSLQVATAVDSHAAPTRMHRLARGQLLRAWSVRTHAREGVHTEPYSAHQTGSVAFLMHCSTRIPHISATG
jgi:hypothetical protein